MTKTKAFFLHLLISAVAFGALLFVLVRFWYPMPYFVADGGWQGLRLICCIDLVLGPLLTLVVYKDWKPRRALAFDYAVIGTLQAAAFGFGLWTAYAQRTVLVTFTDGTFYTVDAQTASSLGPRATGIRSHSTMTPAYALVAMPEDGNRRQELRKLALKTGRALFMFDELLEDFSLVACERVREYEVDTARLREKWPDAAVAVRRFAERKGRPAEEFAFLPVVSRYRTLLLAFRRTTATQGVASSGGNTVQPDGYLWVGSERDGARRPPSGMFPRVSANASRKGQSG